MHDYHAHSNYSDGRFLPSMCAAAVDAGLDGLGFADHCNVSDREPPAAFKREYGFNLDLTYERRRDAIDAVRERYDLRIYDAVEMDYDPRDEAAIRSFLDEAAFDYAVGSVHAVEGTNLHDEGYFGRKSASEREAVVETYVDRLVSLIDSGLFEIAAHPDLVERNGALRGHLTTDHYERLAAAFADSGTVPELNAGRALEDYGRFHPAEPFVEVLLDHGVSFTVGSDAHSPEEVREQNRALADRFAELGLEPVELSL